MANKPPKRTRTKIRKGAPTVSDAMAVARVALQNPEESLETETVSKAFIDFVVPIVAEEIRDAYNRGVTDEREACAALAEEKALLFDGHGPSFTLSAFADDIRGGPHHND